MCSCAVHTLNALAVPLDMNLGEAGDGNFASRRREIPQISDTPSKRRHRGGVGTNDASQNYEWQFTLQ